MRRIAVLFLPLALAACGRDEPEKTTNLAMKTAATPADADIAGLVPDGAHFVVRLRSVEAADAFVKAAAAATGRPWLMGSIGDQLAMITGGAAVDRAKPLAVAVTFSGSTIPAMTFIVPVSDPAAVASGYQRGASAVRGGYAALSMAPDYQPGKSELGRDLPTGDIAMRIDLAGLLEAFRSEVDASLARFPVEGLREMLDDADRLDLALSMESGTFDAKFAYFGKGEPAAGGANLADLARLLPRDFPFVLLVHFDVAMLLDLAESVTSLLPAASPGPEQMAKWRATAGNFGKDWLVAFDFGAGGPRVVVANRGVESLDAVLAALPATAFEKKRMLGDVMVHRFRIPADDPAFAAAYGAEGVPLDVALLGDRLVLTVGGDALTQEVLGSSRPPASVDAALSGLPGSARFLMRVECRAFVRGMNAFDGGGAVPDGPPVPCLFYGSVDGGVVRGGLRGNIAEASALMQLLR